MCVYDGQIFACGHPGTGAKVATLCDTATKTGRACPRAQAGSFQSKWVCKGCAMVKDGDRGNLHLNLGQFQLLGQGK